MPFDLRVEPAIPVFASANTRSCQDHIKWVGLRELLVNAHLFSDLALTSPPAAAGMLRVLYTIAARITRLDEATNRSDFEERRFDVAESGQFCSSAIDGYLSRSDLDGRWDLFDPVWPWLQDARLAEQAQRKPVNVLDPTRPADNTPIWWQHTSNAHAPEIAAPYALQCLLAHHWFGSGGTGGTRTIGAVSDQHMSAGPLRGTVSFYPLGRTLFETLIAGIPSPGTASGTGKDLAPWEVVDRHDPLVQPPQATWPGGLLTRQNRHAVLLVPTTDETAVCGCYLTWSHKDRHLPIADPYTIQDRINDTWRARPARAARAVWRDLDALLADREGQRRPAVLSATATLPIDWQSALRVRAHGWDQDRQSTDRLVFTATTPELLRWSYENDPDAADGAADLHAAAEDVHDVLCTGLRRAYKNLGTGSSSAHKQDDIPWIAPAQACYWAESEALFWQLLEQRRFDQVYQAFLQPALQAVETATRHLGHHPAVARETAGVGAYLRRYVTKKNPPAKEDQ
ncbi:type I-E CRISPR-associated protein Cse1/CasA [Nocardia farcinica]|uniref:type I-E CRISPR-associated protein Cse1/CasA n=1 Tax=Nocardia farcinica TaxID=37329 RepID=UPI002453F4D1|nr:type I-E CRISPR-associated protein Cse1/CasA [Nocardia farcinica]